MHRYRHILVPLDGSPLAERSLAPACRIARAVAERRAKEPAKQPVRLTLLRALSPTAIVAADPMLYEELNRLGTDEAEAYLRGVRAGLPGSPVNVETHIAPGPAAEAIIHFAEQNEVDLIVISSHGRTGSRRWVYGSVAERVLHHAPCAVAVIRAQTEVEMFQNRKMLVPLDGSALAEAALAPALLLAQSVGSEIMLLRVVQSPTEVPEALTTSRVMNTQDEATWNKAVERERSEAETYLQQIFATHPNQHLFFDVQVAAGPVAETIIEYANTHHVDLIVMSSHGRSGLGRWLYGSVAEKVMGGAHCATLIIRAREPE